MAQADVVDTDEDLVLALFVPHLVTGAAGVGDDRTAYVIAADNDRISDYSRMGTPSSANMSTVAGSVEYRTAPRMPRVASTR